MNEEQTPQDLSYEGRDDAFSELGYGRPVNIPKGRKKKTSKTSQTGKKNDKRSRTSRSRSSTPIFIPFESRNSDEVITDDDKEASRVHIEATRRNLGELATETAQETPAARPPINEGDEVSPALDPPLSVNVVLAINRGNGADPRTHSFDRTVHIPPKTK